MIFYFLKELYPLPHGSDSICFPPLTALTFSILNPEIASGSSSILNPLFWVCKGRNLFVIRKLYFKKLLPLLKLFRSPVSGLQR